MFLPPHTYARFVNRVKMGGRTKVAHTIRKSAKTLTPACVNKTPAWRQRVRSVSRYSAVSGCICERILEVSRRSIVSPSAPGITINLLRLIQGDRARNGECALNARFSSELSNSSRNRRNDWHEDGYNKTQLDLPPGSLSLRAQSVVRS